MIEDGVVNVFEKGSTETPIKTLTTGSFFGEALFSDDVKQETYIAKSDVTVLYLIRDDFVRLLGDNMEKLLNETSNGQKINEEELDSDVKTQILFDQISK